MDTIQTLGSVLVLGFAAGIRLYAALFALGLGIHFGVLPLTSGMSHLAVLSDTRVLMATGAACVIEFFADKIPWLDSMWDSVHTFIRPLGAAVLSFTALGDSDPALKVIMFVLCGGVAFTGHSSKAAARIAANHSPEPFSNIALSAAEDLFVPGLVWMALHHPLLVAAFVVLFVAAFAFVAPRVFRAIRAEWRALTGWISGRRQPAE
ncbi:MAG TPA: DUF4126 domain-containing protein [Bryobacteraceae bacterium]|nr:DUF4126 domain-containing protein [Bryobacteraceae bacterium]